LLIRVNVRGSFSCITAEDVIALAE
jgi:hypothetical protein